MVADRKLLMATWSFRVLRSMVLLVLSSPVLATDFVPIEVGNRWIYVHEIFNGQHVGGNQMIKTMGSRHGATIGRATTGRMT